MSYRCLVLIQVNLLSNAMKFTEHGHVSIAVDGRKLDELPSLRCLEEMPTRLCAGTTPLTEEGSKWEIQISVKDTGIGIPDDRKHTLFQVTVDSESILFLPHTQALIWRG